MKIRQTIQLSFLVSLLLLLTFKPFASEAATESRNGTFEINPDSIQTMLYSNTDVPVTDYATVYANQAALVEIVPEHDGCMNIEITSITTASGKKEEEIMIYFKDVNGNILLDEYVKAGDKKDINICVNAREKYTMIIGPEDDDSEDKFTVKFRAKVYTTQPQRKLPAGTSRWTVVSGLSDVSENDTNYSTTYFKVKAEETGRMAVALKCFGMDVSCGAITLCNSEKQTISDTVKYDSSDNKAKVYFGVKKGRTYYLKVTDCKGVKNEGYSYGIRYSISKATDRALSSKSDAKALVRKGSAVSSLFIASTGTSTDWYKFKVTSKSTPNVKLSVSGIKSGYISISFYQGSQKIGSTYKLTPERGNKTYKLSSNGQKLNTGTYYVKVVKSKYASGKYAIKYVK